MSNCVTQIDETRFITKDPNITHVYVCVSIVRGDCPIGVEGWHYKTFPAEIPAVDIMNLHLKDHVLWPQKVPE